MQFLNFLATHNLYEMESSVKINDKFIWKKELGILINLQLQAFSLRCVKNWTTDDLYVEQWMDLT
jgi:hypothetical protein